MKLFKGILIIGSIASAAVCGMWKWMQHEFKKDVRDGLVDKPPKLHDS